MRLVSVAAAVLVLGTGCVEMDTRERAEASGETGEDGVPIRLAGPGEAALLVPVRINGHGPFDFVLDTGATLTCADAALADSLELPEAQGRVGVGTGIRGGAGAMRLVQIDSVAVGEARVDGLTGCAIDLEQFRAMGLDTHGLLGLNFLTSFTVTLDFQAGRLRLEEPGSTAAGDEP